MPDVRLSCVIGPYDRIIPLMTGEVKPEGITLEFANAPSNPNIMFYDQMQFDLGFPMASRPFAITLRCETTTPFGSLVEPDVYWRKRIGFGSWRADRPTATQATYLAPSRCRFSESFRLL